MTHKEQNTAWTDRIMEMEDDQEAFNDWEEEMQDREHTPDCVTGFKLGWGIRNFQGDVRVMKMYCYNCDWSGDESDLINPQAWGRDYYMCGESCPKCGFDNVSDIKPEEEQNDQIS